VQTFTAFAGESDIAITEDVVDKLIHRRLLKPTFGIRFGIRPAAETSGTLNFLGQEVTDVCMQSGICSTGGTTSELTNAAVFTANKPPGNTAALDVVACIQGCVVIVVDLPGRLTRVERAVERLDLSRPELEIAGSIFAVTRKCNLRGSIGEHV
jgi:hypothetical protein